MPSTISVNATPAQIQVKPGEQVGVAITVRNRSEEVAHYLLSVEGVPPDWAEIQPSQVSAFPLQDVSARLVIHPPAGTRGATYHPILVASMQQAPNMRGSAQVDVDVPEAVQPVSTLPSAQPSAVASRPIAAVQIELQATLVQDPAVPPPGARWQLTLRNAGNVLDSFSFSISGIRPKWFRLEPPELTLKPDETGRATLTVQPGSDAPAGSYSFKLRAFSHLNMNQRTELGLQVQVPLITGFKLGITPPEAESQGARDFRLSLVSDPASNADLWVDLAASDQDDALDYTFDATQVLVSAKQTLTSILHLQAREIQPPNGRKTYTFTVTATPRNGAASAQTIQARFTQVGAAPLSLMIRPQVKSAELAAEYILTALNPATVPATVILAGRDPEEAADYVFQPQRLTLPAHGEAPVQLRVKARNPQQGGSEHPIGFTITITRVGELTPAASIEGKLIQQPLKGVALQLVPPQQTQVARATFFVQLQNPRNTAVQVYLDGRDDEDALAFTFQPSQVQLEPGGVGRVKLLARPKDKLPAGQPRRVHKFSVIGSINGTETTVVANGILAQVAGIDWGNLSLRGANWGFWAVRWILSAGILAFLGTIGLSGALYIAKGNPELAKLLTNIGLSSDLLKLLLDAIPFSDYASRIVELLAGIAATVLHGIRG